MLQQLVKAAQPALLTLVPQLASTTDSSNRDAHKADSDSDSDDIDDIDAYINDTISKTAAAAAAKPTAAAAADVAVSEADVIRWLEAGSLKRSQSAVALMWLTEVADKVPPKDNRYIHYLHHVFSAEAKSKGNAAT